MHPLFQLSSFPPCTFLSCFFFSGFSTPKPPACMAGLGMENDQIPDSAITATSAHGSYRPDQGRLYNQGGSWLADTNNFGQWFQVELGDWTKVTRVCTQGRPNGGQWVTEYKLAYSYDGVFYKEYKEEGEKVKVRVYCMELKRPEKKIRHRSE